MPNHIHLLLAIAGRLALPQVALNVLRPDAVRTSPDRSRQICCTLII
jgi:REP element-mobilizing transposase RayT